MFTFCFTANVWNFLILSTPLMMPDLQAASTIIRIPSFSAEPGEGRLSVLEATSALPFTVDRLFTVVGMNRGKRRGGHSNTIVNEAICCLQGSLKVNTQARDGCREFRLDDPTLVLLIPCRTWADIESLEDNSCYLVLADHTYREAAPHYIHDLERHRALMHSDDP